MAEKFEEHPPCSAWFIERTNRRQIIRVRVGVGRQSIVQFDLTVPVAASLERAVAEAIDQANASGSPRK